MKNRAGSWIGPALVLLSAAGLAAFRVVLLDGWPHNHDGVACFQKVEIFRRAFGRGDLLPLWTSLAENGHGSPFPLFYHRLFNSLGGALALLTGSTYTAVKALIPLLLFIGGLGTYRVLRSMGLDLGLALGGAVLHVFSNYAYTDWYVRGAFGEFAAFVLVPWVFLAALGVARGSGRAPLALGTGVSLLFFSQSVVFTFSFPLVAIAFLAAFARRGGREVVRGLLVSGAVVIALTGPFLAAMSILGRGLPLDVLREGAFDVFRNFDALSRYLYDADYGWTSSTAGYSVEIGRGFNTAALVCLAAAAVLAMRSREARRRIAERGEAWFLVVAAGAAYLFLQMPVSAWLYRLVPPLRFLQFPWRLLVFSTPASIFGLCLALDLLESRTARRAGTMAFRVAFLFVVAFQVWFGVSRPLTRAVFSRAEVEASLTTERLARTPVFSGAFRPRGALAPVSRPFFETKGCTVVSADPGESLAGVVEVRTARIVVDSETACRVFVNLFVTPLLSVDAGPGGRVRRTAEFTYVVEPAPGRREVAVRRRRLFAAMAAGLRSPDPQ